LTRRLLEHLNHELRSPMTVVVGLTDLMLLSPASAEQAQYLHSVRQAADALLRMLDEAVDLSRLEVGGLDLNEIEFSLSQVVEQARETLQSSAAPIELSVEIDEALPKRLAGDADRLRQIVVGLARSAAKFRIDRAFRLLISGESAAEGKLALDLALGDAQKPFSIEPADENQGQVLSLASFSEHGYRGPGLALPVLAGLAELMGGRLWMATDARSPLIFRLTARFAPGDGRRRGAFLAALEDQLGTSAVRRSLRLLLVEDTPANNRFFTSVLSRRGHEVVAVSNGQEAIEVSQSLGNDEQFDLALIDLEMPMMNGWQTAAELRQLENFQRHPMPLVALTAHAPDSRALQGGPFDATITKPCELEHFYSVVESLAVGQPVAAAPQIALPSRDERVDYRGTLRRLGGDESLFHDLVRFCLEDTPVVLAELAKAIECGDARGIERSAHSLKGLVANFGAKDAAQWAADMQRLGHDSLHAEAQAAFPGLVNEVRLFVDELSAYRRP
jgi:CheY-like chemotaxis protein